MNGFSYKNFLYLKHITHISKIRLLYFEVSKPAQGKTTEKEYSKKQVSTTFVWMYCEENTRKSQESSSIWGEHIMYDIDFVLPLQTTKKLTIYLKQHVSNTKQRAIFFERKKKYICIQASVIAQLVKNPPAKQETMV